MAGFRVFMKAGGWRVTDGAAEHGPFPTYGQAVRSAENLNLQRRAEEVRSFAPGNASVNVQGGLPLTHSAVRIAPEVIAGDRREGRLVSGEGHEEKVIHGARPEHPLPPQMVSETRGAEADQPLGDVLQYPETPDVWEALEADPEPPTADEERAAQEAIARARVKGTDSPAAGSASLGGGLV
jgi:hypothetical protein